MTSTDCTCTWGTLVTTSYPRGISAYGITANDPRCPHHGSDPATQADVSIPNDAPDGISVDDVVQKVADGSWCSGYTGTVREVHDKGSAVTPLTITVGVEWDLNRGTITYYPARLLTRIDRDWICGNCDRDSGPGIACCGDPDPLTYVDGKSCTPRDLQPAAVESADEQRRRNV